MDATLPIVVGAGITMAIVIGVAIVLPKLKSRAMGWLVAYVKQHFPADWHLPVTRTWLRWMSLVIPVAVACVLFDVMNPTSMSNFWVWSLVVIALYVIAFWAFIAGKIERKLSAQLMHRFYPRNDTMHMLLAVLVALHTPSQVLRACARLRIFPTDDIAAWPCQLCGEPEVSLRHGIPRPRVVPTWKAAHSVGRRLSES